MISGIHQYSPIFHDALRLFIENHTESVFFQSIPYINLLTELLNSKQEHLLYFENDKIVGVLPILSKTGSFGKVYNSLPYFGSNGGVLARDYSMGKELINEYNELINNDNIASSTCIENPIAKNNYQDFILHNVTDYRIGQFTNIEYTDNHEEKLMKSFHYKTRNMVRKGMKSGLVIKIQSDSMDFLSDIHQSNLKAIGGIPKSRIFFDLITKHFTQDADYKIWVAYIGEEPVAALLLFYYRNMVEYYTPVIVEKHRDKQPLSLLIYEAMTDASKKGYKLWNWGGTWATQDGVYTFKKRWGTFDKSYTYYTYINKSDIYHCKSEILLNEYSGFFVVPFRLLKQV